MACAHPLLNTFVKNTHPFYKGGLRFYENYIPCNRCINCRIDKINMYTHRCEQELIDRKCGAFVTLTYDDIHIQPFLKNVDGKILSTLSRIEIKRYLDRLNKLVHKTVKDSGYKNLPFCQKDYKYLVAGEYGDHGKVFDRCHYHCIFFGLDYAACKKLFARAWQGKGMIKVLPILNGCFRYCLDYLTGLEYGEQRKIKYYDKGIEPPFQTHSLGLGKSLYENQLDYIKTHNNCYKWHGKDIPIPTYYRNKYLLPKQDPLKRYKRIAAEAYHEGVIPSEDINLDNLYNLHEYYFNKSKNREYNLNHNLKASGRPMIDLDYIDELVHDYKIDNSPYFKLLHPIKSQYLYQNYSPDDINLLVQQAELSQIPF